MNAGRQRATRTLVLVLDGALVLLAMLLAVGIHAALRSRWSAIQEVPSAEHYAVLPYVTLPLFLAAIAFLRLHTVLEETWPRRRLWVALGKLHLFAFVSLAILIFLTRSVINRSLTAVFLLCTFILLYAASALLTRWRRYQHASGQGRLRMLLVGESRGPLGAFFQACRQTDFPPAVVGVLSEDASGGLEGLGRLGRPEDLSRVLHDEPVDEVLFFPPFHRAAELQEAQTVCESLGVVARFYVEGKSPSNAPPILSVVHGSPFIAFDALPKSELGLSLKHSLDALLAALGLVLISPLLLLVAAAVLFTMGRPVLFFQDRAGLFGRRFRMLKFRTMVKDAEAQQGALLDRNELSGPAFKLTDDPRVTRLGHFLRKSSIDELPQLVNVLLGSMSLVGPRPLPIHEQQQIRGWHRRRLSMKPGITGLWQVQGRSDVDFDEWMELDLRYVDNWSFLGDLKLLLRTLPVVFFGRGAR